MSTNTAEDEEEKRRIEAEQRIDYKSELDKKDDLIRKLIEELEWMLDVKFESWAKRSDVVITDEEIEELLRIKNKQS